MASLSFFLRINAASCLAFGATFLTVPDATASLLGAAPPKVVFALGVLLVGNGAHLLLASQRDRPIDAEILWFAFGDMVWWLASLGLVAAGVWITAPLGVVLTLLVASGVAMLGVAQLVQLGRHRSGLSTAGQWQRIGQSWLSLPAWVKMWLVFLNAVFLAAPALVPWDSARIILVAYAASGPLLLGFAGLAGGLTRAMGIGHIVPWVPLLVWLVLTARASGAGMVQSGYAAVLAVAICVCLAFDFHDLYRWCRGERQIILRPARPRRSLSEPPFRT